MRSLRLILSVLFLTGALGFIATPLWAEGVLLKVRAGNTNYCHMTFPAIRENTLTWARPVLKDASSGDIIDFYGSCDYDPLGKEAVHDQMRHLRHQRGHDFSS